MVTIKINNNVHIILEVIYLPRNKQYKKNKQDKISETTLNSDIAGISIFAFGAFAAVSMFFTSFTGIIGNGMKKLLFTLVGIGAYIFPILLMFIGVCYLIKKGKITFSKRFYGVNIIIINTLMLIQMQKLSLYYNGNILDGIKKIYESSDTFHGGVISYILDVPIYKLFGKGYFVLFITLYIISFLLVSEKSAGEIIRENLKKKPLKKTKPSVDETKTMDYENDNKDKDETLAKKISSKIKIVDFMKNEGNVDSNKGQALEEIAVYDSAEKNENESKVIGAELEDAIGQTSSNNSDITYEFPPISLLNVNETSKLKKSDKKELLSSAEKLTETLNSFGVDAKVIQVSKGPSVTRYELQPSAGVKVSKIINLSDDIALNLAASGVRIEAPIPGKSAIGIEVPNKDLTAVFLSEVIQSETFSNSKSNLAFALGKDIGGNCVVTDLTKMPHLLIAGATGSGKSVCINTLIISLLYKCAPTDVKLLMIDPKVVELSVYNGIPHLLIPVVTNPKKAAGALNWAVNEMTKRYKLFAENNVRNIEGYNDLYTKNKVESKLPWIVIIIDELADLMMVCPNDVEDYIGRLAQMARAAGMHLVIATQRPSVDVITGVIKANIPSRISFAVSSQIDSRTILDTSGAEKLLGKGDMLFNPVGESKPIRIQGAFINEEEVERVVGFIRNESTETQYKEEIIEQINSNVSKSEGDEDELLEEALKIIIETKQASTSLIQRKLRIGYNRAARIMDQLEEKGYISAKDGTKPRNILVDKDDL
ncbi:MULTISPECIES: DNA translocase FtsK [Clostridium]|uniref:DNA translocase FtsK n=1 Tax=Clostridium acetobutylicum (strain ATCC 824 / DSM 792 / JCM 1419 / IAM 19013 / LMG 5710 / NBRC 13948 / NRRL B-527 / VKM B-1787 / 2291 / W) TaxID=272562 RepID=FTSK_CLOAB|nr:MULTISPECIES: DNA translocase FtsK [Clostridium]Q97I41.1 RecName: Full=DNA translocase FtsK [Clostridium acetobutylicum ATCC 824]AAK79777.1 Sporulation protein SpoIIIE, DNA segregation ATPase [Clostridium acetobutylicum ATCC 824]ADZ20862.1 Sporulation protein SpoIIIE, DNA segregation ATPase [Clostridium acetobutylicum EA 2018]AEI34346.1 sporulation protein SpoIIIE, DNA segregation ATPase [Clostridium acetobutylicum DSM 1731]AWV79788.1 DNA translocase FtsK [Clostridium acetobutylicum]MBC239